MCLVHSFSFSGVSWAINHGKKSIRLIQNWPKTGAINNNDVKVPTTIVYDSTGKPANWGYTIGFKEESLRWFKILLEADPRYSDKAREIHETRILLENLGKTPVEVAGDYLGKIWEYTQKDIRRHMGCDGWQQDCEILFVVTVPAVWSASAKQKTLDAAAAAGLGPRIQLLTEPQAAALAALEEMEDQDRLKVWKCFTFFCLYCHCSDVAADSFPTPDWRSIYHLRCGGWNCGMYCAHSPCVLYSSFPLPYVLELPSRNTAHH